MLRETTERVSRLAIPFVPGAEKVRRTSRCLRGRPATAVGAEVDHRFRSGSATCSCGLVRCFVQGRTLFVDHEAHQVGCEIDRTLARFDTVPEARRGPIIADSARPETISYM
jgi:hypothetical protein